ncbi:MAG: hypothetical protein E7447_01280 [Ruminococcaceae bacterium]|nr:hypothetical protein [Oscillospiraceae bacterium]
MAIVTTDDKYYKNIAKAIRDLSGENAAYTPEEMPAAMDKVYEKGYAQGYHSGYGEGHTEGMEDGEMVYRQRFWDQYQAEGARTDYNFAFAGPGWNEETFWPQYDIVVEKGYQMFAYSGFSGSLKARLEACNVQMIFGDNQLLMNLFGLAANITELGVIDLSAVTPSSSHTHIFNQCTALKTIEKLIVPAGQPVWTAWFSNCSALENLQIEGIISSTGMDLSGCPKLTRESILSVLNALGNKNGLSGTWKLTLGATNLAKLTESDKAIATGKGWTLA